jgi:hypothetical protein
MLLYKMVGVCNIHHGTMIEIIEDFECLHILL